MASSRRGLVAPQNTFIDTINRKAAAQGLSLCLSLTLFCIVMYLCVCGLCSDTRMTRGDQRIYEILLKSEYVSVCRPQNTYTRYAFNARRYASAVLAVILRHLSVRPSDTRRYSTKTAKPMITQTTSYNSPGTLVFWCQRFRQHFTGSPATGAPKKGDFRPRSRYISETVQDRDIVRPIWNGNRNFCAFYRMMLFSLTLGDPNYPKPHPISIFCNPFHTFLVGGDGDFKFGRQVDLASASPWMINHP